MPGQAKANGFVSVTRVLGILKRYEGVSPQVLQKAAELGTAVHAHCLGHLKGLHIPVPEQVRPYYEAFCEWARLNIEEVIAVEAEVMDSQLRVIGHLDLACRVNGRTCIIDLKRTTGKPDRIVALQLAAYQRLAESTFKRKFQRRHALHLPANGPVQLIEFADDRNWSGFLCALSLYNHLGQ